MDEAEAVKLVDEKTRYDKEKGCYVTGLPWKLPTKVKDTNRESVERMAEKFCVQLQANPKRAQGWCNSYADAEEKGFCRPLTEEELKDNSPNVHYIQTFCVHQPHKPSHPYWLVVAAKQTMGDKDGKKSMNDLLYTGPNLLKDLTLLIIRARSAIFMLLADI